MRAGSSSGALVAGSSRQWRRSRWCRRMYGGSLLQACPHPALRAVAPSSACSARRDSGTPDSARIILSWRAAVRVGYVGLAFAQFRRAAVRARQFRLCLSLPCALRCGLSPSSAHEGRGRPDPGLARPVPARRAAVQTSQLGRCPPSSCVWRRPIRSGGVCLVSFFPDGVGKASDPGMVGGRLASG